MHVADQYGEEASDFLGATRKALAALRLIHNMRSHVTDFTLAQPSGPWKY